MKLLIFELLDNIKASVKFDNYLTEKSIKPNYMSVIVTSPSKPYYKSDIIKPKEIVSIETTNRFSETSSAYQKQSLGTKESDGSQTGSKVETTTDTSAQIPKLETYKSSPLQADLPRKSI